ncbi:MAG: helix-turn-helix domain-containing protein [Parvibaculum sp.]|nr:helix-turn-helix domain-containing protein [Parvibaculum sp.]
MITAEQLRAARAMLRWEQKDLAEKAQVSLPTVKRLEAMSGSLMAVRVDTIEALKRAIQAGGIEFIPENGGGAGIRFRDREAPPSDEGIKPDKLTSENDG